MGSDPPRRSFQLNGNSRSDAKAWEGVHSFALVSCLLGRKIKARLEKRNPNNTSRLSDITCFFVLYLKFSFFLSAVHFTHFLFHFFSEPTNKELSNGMLETQWVLPNGTISPQLGFAFLLILRKINFRKEGYCMIRKKRYFVKTKTNNTWSTTSLKI